MILRIAFSSYLLVVLALHLAGHFYLVDLAYALLFQFLALGVGLLLWAAWQQQWIWAGVLAFGVGSHLYRAYPSGPFVSIDEEPTTGLGIVQANLWHNNPDWRAALCQLANVEADVLAVQEFNSVWVAAADSLLGPRFPHRVQVPHDSCCYGMALYSAHPIRSQLVYGWGGAPTIRVVIETPLGELVVYAAHTRPPAFPNQTVLRDQLLDSLAANINTEILPVVVLGDLNIVPWDPVYRSFLTSTQLTDARTGFHATYPMDAGIPLIPIDHIAVKGLATSGFFSFELTGSDHKAVCCFVGRPVDGLSMVSSR